MLESLRMNLICSFGTINRSSASFGCDVGRVTIVGLGGCLDSIRLKGEN